MVLDVLACGAVDVAGVDVGAMGGTIVGDTGVDVDAMGGTIVGDTGVGATELAGDEVTGAEVTDDIGTGGGVTGDGKPWGEDEVAGVPAAPGPKSKEV